MIALLCLALVGAAFGQTNTIGYVKTCINKAVDTCNAQHPISACLMEKGKKMQSCIETSTGMPADSELCSKVLDLPHTFIMEGPGNSTDTEQIHKSSKPFGPPLHLSKSNSQPTMDPKIAEFVKCIVEESDRCSKNCTAPQNTDAGFVKNVAKAMEKCRADSGLDTCF